MLTRFKQSKLFFLDSRDCLNYYRYLFSAANA